METLFEQLCGLGIVPVIALEESDAAPELGRALCEGGLPCAEITFRTEAAEEAIRKMTAACPEMLIGAGTILTAAQAEQAIKAGARFIVSPGLNPAVVSHCLSRNIPILPGCATPSEVEQAISLGLHTVKFFPAEPAGGLAMIQAMSAPYSNIRFMPTGGIHPGNLNTYLAFPKILACGGSWMATPAMIKSHDFASIRRLTKEAVSIMLNLKIEQLQLAAADSDTASAFLAGLGMSVGFQKYPESKTAGIITISSGDLKRALFHLRLNGLIFRAGSEEYAADGSLASIDMNGSLNGYTFRFIQKK